MTQDYKTLEVADEVLRLLRYKPRTKYEIATVLNVHHRTALRLMQALLRTGRVKPTTKAGSRMTYYALNKG